MAGRAWCALSGSKKVARQRGNGITDSLPSGSGNLNPDAEAAAPCSATTNVKKDGILLSVRCDSSCSVKKAKEGDAIAKSLSCLHSE
jgi:hypothetical protein